MNLVLERRKSSMDCALSRQLRCFRVGPDGVHAAVSLSGKLLLEGDLCTLYFKPPGAHSRACVHRAHCMYRCVTVI